MAGRVYNQLRGLLMFRSRPLQVLVLLTCGVTAVNADTPTPTVYGAGAGASCGKWLADRRGNNWYTELNWVLGWVSAAGQYGFLPLRHTDSDAMAAWVDNYCHEHPLDQLYIAASALVEELRKPAS